MVLTNTRIPAERYAGPRIKNPVRYPGGKGREAFVSQFVALFPEGHLDGRLWVEPLCGGCGLGLSLLSRGIVGACLFNDGDVRVLSMWKTIAHDSERLSSDVVKTVPSMKRFWEAKATAADDDASRYDRGYATYLLDRWCRSGYIDGGVIGGNKQDGNYKMDCRFNRSVLAEDIRAIGALAADGYLHYTAEPTSCLSMLTAMKDEMDADPSIAPEKRPFIYMDPPYVMKGAACYKLGAFDHKALSAMVHDGGKNLMPFEWAMSYDDCPDVWSLYSGCRIDRIEVSYSNNTATRGRKSELIVRPRS